ncbi:MAG TPA: histidinol-phosphatase [Pirellulales bacterium]|jgi:histidinol phosphatase-like enzyme (inositol monophosphatase family)
MNQHFADRLEVARRIAREAGDITLRYFGQDNFQVEWKPDASPVTVADREAEKHLRLRIAEAFPQDAILGEELGEQPGSSGFRWILDPIDGTKSFIYGVPLYGTLIGVEFEERSVVGVIHIPGLDETVYAASGGGAWFCRGAASPRRTHVSKTKSLGEGLFCTSDVKGFGERGSAPAYERLQAAARFCRTWGDCYGYLLIATGRADLMVDPRMHIWDCAALQPVIEEAGGTFTDWNGKATIYGFEGVATNGLVLEETLALLRE